MGQFCYIRKEMDQSNQSYYCEIMAKENLADLCKNAEFAPQWQQKIFNDPEEQKLKIFFWRWQNKIENR